MPSHTNMRSLLLLPLVYLLNLGVWTVQLTLSLFKWLRPPALSGRLLEWKSRGKYFNFRGHDIFYVDENGEGDEPPFVCIHGYPMNSHDWRLMFPGLKRRFSRVIAPDLFGMGFSAKPIQQYLLMDQTDMVEELLKSLGVKSFSFITHDYSVSVGQELLARYADRQRGNIDGMKVNHGFFTNGGLFPETHTPLGIQKYGAIPFIGHIYTFFMFYTGRAYRLIPFLFSPERRPSEDEVYDMWCVVRYNRGELINHQLLQYMEQRRQTRDRWVGALQTTTVPLHLIMGARDPINPAYLADHYKKMVPQSDLTVFNDVSHWPSLEKPEETVAAILKTVDKNKAKRSP